MAISLPPPQPLPFLQGYQYNITFPLAHAPVGSLNISIFNSTNCGQAAPLHTFPAAAAQLSASEAWVPVTAPSSFTSASSTGGQLFMQIVGPTGRRGGGCTRPASMQYWGGWGGLLRWLREHMGGTHGSWSSLIASVAGQKNYSELFSIQPKYIQSAGACILNPAAPITPPPPTLNPFCNNLPMNLTSIGIGGMACLNDNGCRDYR